MMVDISRRLNKRKLSLKYLMKISSPRRTRIGFCNMPTADLIICTVFTKDMSWWTLSVVGLFLRRCIVPCLWSRPVSPSHHVMLCFPTPQSFKNGQDLFEDVPAEGSLIRFCWVTHLFKLQEGMSVSTRPRQMKTLFTCSSSQGSRALVADKHVTCQPGHYLHEKGKSRFRWVLVKSSAEDSKDCCQRGRRHWRITKTRQIM